MDNKKGITRKIALAFGSMTIALTLILTSIWYRDTTRVVTDLVETYTYKLLEDSNNSFENTLTNNQYLTSIMAFNNSTIMKILEENLETQDKTTIFNNNIKMHEYLTQMITNNYDISGIQIMDSKGRIYTEGNGRMLSEASVRAYFNNKNLKDNIVKIQVNSAYDLNTISKTKTNDVISYIAKIRKGDKNLGIIVVNCTYELINSKLGSQFPTNSSVFMVDGDNKIIYNNNDASTLGDNISSTDYKGVLNKIPYNNGYFLQEINGESMFVVYYKSKFTKWITFALVPESSLLQKSSSAIRNTLSYSVILLIVSLIIAIVLSYSISKNIHRLRKGMEKIKNGDLTTKIIINSNDEIEDLSITFNNMMDQITTLLQDIKTQEMKKRLLEIKTLQSQINPHFVSNTLHTIKWLSDTQRIDNISNLTNSIIELLNVSMGKTNEFITIEEEFQYIKHYINIEQYKYYDNLNVVFKLSDEIMHYKIPKLLLQPIVENAIIHGIDQAEKDGIVLLQGFLKDDLIYITVEDTGVGMDQSTIDKLLHNTEHKGRLNSIGLKNIDDRLKLYYGNDYGINIVSVLGNFTRVEITIPVTSQTEQ
ncbi:sensor histidine kinase [Clostridium cellulovorans]|uniref:Integral membrane sensor signal transduction histidine kinase n=1 Tax=Clostridium cellulovorans (strain ATCC 35296 / DSM 3052 / OCM 3 / 743B) TaxID=573061 RepID=D9SM76_CLOC7|nr:sensor histidine kinase [Clostridium cellulovorans]ADL53732.1 integral membrane sensor signal transduction histidine kinase [Clostridium cellulovorans 743B]